jgi:outer membrane lipoprotein-sorting protein
VDNPGKAIELMRSAGASFRTLQGKLMVWRYDAPADHAATVLLSRAAGGALYAKRTQDSSLSDSQEQQHTDFWHVRPDRTRLESESKGLVGLRLVTTQKYLTIRNRESWLTSSDETGTVVGHDAETAESLVHQQRLSYVIEPSIFPEFREPRLLDAEYQNERPAISLRARPPELNSIPTNVDLGPLGYGDSYELSVDAERGLVTRVVVRFGDAIVQTLTADNLVFDAEIDPAVFAIEPPPGRKVRQAADVLPRYLAIADAAQEVPVTVFVPATLPDEAHLDFVYEPRDGILIVSYGWDGESAAKLIQIIQGQRPNRTIEKLFKEGHRDEVYLDGVPVYITKPEAEPETFLSLGWRVERPISLSALI